ncbi:hypothetical protein VCV51_032695 [Vibrio cholerae V51]|uniref:hypothetical protein n=2 Tax=Vibrionaceae TaxID=641 RepID=UPI0002E11A9F|nr:hypothetical protein [Vibrio cholerae]EMC8696571.1 hypothetical protein [Vibrio cholerae]KFD96724.1 hypothetical protein DN33_170 [Vibrio cholerae]KNA58486.1 hypothetical protein VCV51_032695 [Vibrio cholerae V51]GIB64836.1 hypothetical protein VCSRO141_0644 [Vibrio cholerae]HCF7740799.1 hypothetical protein [Vibrio cholerae]
MLIIRVLPNSKAVDALVICHQHKRIYRHEGKEYWVKSLVVNGAGRSTRIQAQL